MDTWCVSPLSRTAIFSHFSSTGKREDLGTKWRTISTLSTRIDKNMVENPKFHIFDAFTKLKGENFYDHLKNSNLQLNPYIVYQKEIIQWSIWKIFRPLFKNYNRDVLHLYRFRFSEKIYPNFSSENAYKIYHQFGFQNKIMRNCV